MENSEKFGIAPLNINPVTEVLGERNVLSVLRFKWLLKEEEKNGITT